MKTVTALTAAILATGWAVASGQQAASKPSGTQLPARAAPPAFDYTKIDRTLREPPYSGKPLYRFVAAGPEGKTVIAFVIDSGPDKGGHALYVDLNANRDLTEPGEKFPLTGGVPKPVQGRADMFTCGLGAPDLKNKALAVEDPTFDYSITGGDGILFRVATKDGRFVVPLTTYSPTALWAATRDSAPVLRLGGPEFDLANERFVEGKRAAGDPADDVGRKLSLGAKLSVDGTTPTFAGSSPTAMVGTWAHWAYRPNLKVWLEKADDPNRPRVMDIDVRDY